ncbi:hypothetical protein PMAYCL1PPCAC_22086 [Pristionchus mayeri]|uniref:Protein kinase domain-containing protein n=1 Tax=Pristionchus mayeri TaxID=1317129 RepID=A0AAN5CVP6_9BILA|nr:hypothetical protein PMAYCL1PPCAC_22086 [Pristionchus mayeri]
MLMEFSVNILACVTLSEPILLISEYCQHGDLLAFMKQKRNFMLAHPEELHEGKIMTFKKQVMFAIQIAYGMEYISSRGFIHRDIAARNVLIDDRETCKIGDYGLCRAIGKEEDNYMSHGGKLPLKWMSPEAIEKYNFSVASDVWSYGILLFEIITLGGTPYADWAAAELLTRLKRGDRMERPSNCNDSIFELMTQCWTGKPADRPTFSYLRKQLGILLEDANQDEYYLKLNGAANYYNLDNRETHSASASSHCLKIIFLYVDCFLVLVYIVRFT